MRLQSMQKHMDHRHQEWLFQSWPGLFAKLVEKQLQTTPATPKGHMRQQRMNIRSTKPKPTQETPQNQVVMTSSIEERKHLTTFKVIPLDRKVFFRPNWTFPFNFKSWFKVYINSPRCRYQCNFSQTPKKSVTGRTTRKANKAALLPDRPWTQTENTNIR